ncbi:hypothetical protein [Rhodopirellula baltica]
MMSQAATEVIVAGVMEALAASMRFATQQPNAAATNTRTRLVITPVVISRVSGCERGRIAGRETFVACFVDAMVSGVMRHVRLPLHGKACRFGYFREQLGISLGRFAGRKILSLRCEDLSFGFVSGKCPSAALYTFTQGLPFRLNKWIVHWMPHKLKTETWQTCKVRAIRPIGCQSFADTFIEV